jgi:choline dehydrogenase
LSTPSQSLVVRVGKVLGGTSGINAMFFNRGHPLDYDNWANLTNDLSWKYENLLPYFKMVEAYSGAFPLTGRHKDYRTDMHSTLIKHV